jgi:hypothetical protein
MSGTVYKGFASVTATTNEAEGLEFVADQAISRMATATVVKIVGIDGGKGAVAAPGRVHVQPMVKQVDGDGKNPMDHGTIWDLPYHRQGGGTDAIIADPKVGDIGIVVHSSRDISGVKANRDASVPGSMRRYDHADGIYVGQCLNLTPEAYLRFSDTGIELVSPIEVRITSPKITLTATENVSINAPEIDLNKS